MPPPPPPFPFPFVKFGGRSQVAATCLEANVNVSCVCVNPSDSRNAMTGATPPVMDSVRNAMWSRGTLWRISSSDKSRDIWLKDEHNSREDRALGVEDSHERRQGSNMDKDDGEGEDEGDAIMAIWCQGSAFH